MCAMYHPPNSSVDFTNELNHYLMFHVSHTNNFISIGDFNLPSIDWDSLTVGTNERTVGEAFLDLTFPH